MTPPRLLRMVSITVSSVAGIEPKLIGEIWRAELRIALAVGAMTGGAICGEDLCPTLGGRLVVGLAGQREDIFRDIEDLRLRQNPGAPEGRHLARMRLGVVGANAVQERLVDGSERAVAPEPGIVAKIWIADRTLRAPAMTWRAIVAERRLAAGKGKAQQLRIVVDGGKVHRRDLVAVDGLFALGRRDLLGDPLALAVAEVTPWYRC